LKIAWRHPAEGFYQLFKQEVDTQIAKRRQALWVLRRGERLKRVKEMGVQPQADSAGGRAWKGARVKCVVWDHATFPKGKAAGEGGLWRVYQAVLLS